MIKFASFKYDNSANLGDQIQSLAAEQFLPSIDIKLNRDTLNNVYSKEKYIVIMNGWFSNIPENWPPSEAIVPIFVGFHITDWNNSKEYILSEQGVEYLKKYEPIGCRDRKTFEILKKKGIETYYSKCLTLTFPGRNKIPKKGKIFLVDVMDIPLPGYIWRTSIKVSHIVGSFYDDEIKSSMAKKLLSLYKDNASLVITTRLHCALPCIAMGIPIIFFGDPEDYRISILKDLNVKIYKYKRYKNCLVQHIYKHYFKYFKKSKINWNPEPVNIECEKNELLSNVENLIKKYINI